ncbi:hypothetical protein CIT26_11230 [Mesorhizobium temperatum]|uniref:Transposase DDE domain-containing protein n=1 Tax=Mesorhizobium temperatum TaxID=241416 RepID=A0A271LQM1_9HYPH|nr:hypothetical protein CIT26_11230 [Mesorhizobium temperatum]
MIQASDVDSSESGPDGRHLQRRWVVERTFGWMTRWRRRQPNVFVWRPTKCVKQALERGFGSTKTQAL